MLTDKSIGQKKTPEYTRRFLFAWGRLLFVDDYSPINPLYFATTLAGRGM